MRKDSTEAARKAVARGAALLDQHEPSWPSRIDLDTLELASPCRCVLGQVFESFHIGLEALGVTSSSLLEVVATHGFCGSSLIHYPELNAAWKDHIEAAQSPSA